MIRYLVFPAVVLAVIVLQVTLVDIFSAGVIRLEVALVLAVYCGFYMDLFEGAALVLILGFILDTLTATIPLFYTLFYILVFLAAKLASFRVHGEGLLFVIGFTFFCSLVEWIAGSFLSWHFLTIHPPVHTFGLVIIQSLFLASVVPLFFAVFKKCEGVVHAGTSE